jgi:hypothetical protein
MRAMPALSRSWVLLCVALSCTWVLRAVLSPVPASPQRLSASPELVAVDESPACRAASRRSSRPGTPHGPPVQHIHIGKAGGSTAIVALRSWATSAGVAVTPITPSDHYWQCAVPAGPQSGLLLGHVGFGYSKDTRADALKITVFRDPLERCISYFDMSRFVQQVRARQVS